MCQSLSNTIHWLRTNDACSLVQKDGLIWNGDPLSLGAWYDLPSHNLAVGYLDLIESVHEFYHEEPNVNFLILEYGLAQYASYGTVSGSRAAPINEVSLL